MQNNIENKKPIIVSTHFSYLFPPFLYTYISKASCGNCSPPSCLLITNYNHPLNHPLHLHPSHSICNVNFLKKLPPFFKIFHHVSYVGLWPIPLHGIVGIFPLITNWVLPTTLFARSQILVIKISINCIVQFLINILIILLVECQ
jgi:hypothetical protein